LGATYSIFISQNKQISKQDKIVELKQNVRAAMDMMSREVRMAGYDPKPCASSFDGITVSSAQLELKADLSGGGVVGAVASGINDEWIIYAYDSTNKVITRKVVNVDSTPQPFAENITAFTFSLLDGSDSVTTIPANIRKVRLTITGRTFAPIEDGSYPTYTLSADVYARNLAF
jgi:type IV pilus assembly protein PilW